MAHLAFRNVAILVGVLGASGCSMQKLAVNRMGDAIASGGTVYQSDDDLELVGDAFPFSLKLVESLLAESPLHRGLLLTACRGFTSYSYAYVHGAVDEIAESDLARSRETLRRARRLYLRAHRYGMRGLELDHPGIGEAVARDPAAAMTGVTERKQVPLLYWTAASLGLAISSSRNEAAMLARLPEVDAMLTRALALDESYGDGALHEFEVVLSSARPGGLVPEDASAHFERALELSRGTRAGLFVSYAEAVAVPRQDRDQFESLLDKALAVDPDAHEPLRLMNLVAHKRARWLLSHADELILSAE